MMRLWGCLVMVVALALASCSVFRPVDRSVDKYFVKDRAERARKEAEREEARAAEVAAQDAERAEKQAKKDARAEVARERAAVAAKEQSEYEESVSARATKEGFQHVLFRRGLGVVLDHAIDGNATIENAPGIAIELYKFDDGWTARQAFKGGALYSSTYSRATVWFEGAASTVIVGSPLRAQCDFVEITGIRNYPNALGTTAQAFVVRCAWPRD